MAEKGTYEGSELRASEVEVQSLLFSAFEAVGWISSLGEAYCRIEEGPKRPGATPTLRPGRGRRGAGCRKKTRA